jgi:hypothetical protein
MVAREARLEAAIRRGGAGRERRVVGSSAAMASACAPRASVQAVTVTSSARVVTA